MMAAENGHHSSISSSPFIKDPSAFTALTKIHTKAILDCRFSPDTDQIITGGEDKSVVLWNLPNKDTELHNDTINDEHKLVCYRLSDHVDAVKSVAIHERLFASASIDGYVKLWKLLPLGSSHKSSLRASSSSGDCLANDSFKQPLPEPITYKCHTSTIRSIDMSLNANSFATGSTDKSVKVWSTECKNKMLAALTIGHHNWVNCVRWAKTDDSMLASCGDDGKICIWDMRTRVKQPPVTLAPKKKVAFNCIDWHPIFGHHLASGAKDASCVVWDLRNLKQVQIYIEHSESVNSVAFDSGGSLLLTGSSDKRSKILDVCEGRTMFTLISHSAPITSVCFNSTGELFATGSQDKTVTVWKRNFDTISIVLDSDDITNADETNNDSRLLDGNDEDDEINRTDYDNSAHVFNHNNCDYEGELRYNSAAARRYHPFEEHIQHDDNLESARVEYRSQDQLYSNHNPTVIRRPRFNNYPNGIIKR